MTAELRVQILILLELHARSGSATYKEDSELADETGAAVDDVRRQLDILEAQDLINSANTMGSHAARLSPQGTLAVEELIETATEPEKPTIGSELHQMIHDGLTGEGKEWS